MVFSNDDDLSSTLEDGIDAAYCTLSNGADDGADADTAAAADDDDDDDNDGDDDNNGDDGCGVSGDDDAGDDDVGDDDAGDDDDADGIKPLPGVEDANKNTGVLVLCFNTSDEDDEVQFGSTSLDINTGVEASTSGIDDISDDNMSCAIEELTNNISSTVVENVVVDSEASSVDEEKDGGLAIVGVVGVIEGIISVVESLLTLIVFDIVRYDVSYTVALRFAATVCASALCIASTTMTVRIT